MSLKAVRMMLLGLIALPTLATASVAEPSEATNERFTMSPVEGGFLRLDKQTGAVAMCAKSGNDWACKPVEDQTTSGTGSNLSRLESENHDLKSRVKDLEDLLENHSSGPPPPPLNGPLADGRQIGPPSGTSQLPSDEEVDQALDYMSRLYKKIREHIKDLDKPLPPGEHTSPPPPPAQAPPAPKGSL